MFKRFWWVFLVMIPVGAICGLLVAAVVTYVMPKKYESQAVIEVRPLHLATSESEPMTPQFFGTEFEKIKSHDFLGKVVENLELTQKWGLDREAAVRILKGIVSTQNIRGTDLISIRVRHTDKEETRNIATEVARIYQDQRAEAAREGRQHELAEVTESVREQEGKVEDRRRALEEIVRSGRPFQAQDYVKAKREFELEQTRSQELRLKQISLSMEGARDSVIIHEEPRIPQVPVSPHVTLNLVLGTTLGLLVSPLMALSVIFLLGRFVANTPPALPSASA